MPRASASEMVCSISGTSSWNGTRCDGSESAIRKEASARSAALRTDSSCCACSEERKTSRSMPWCAAIFSAMNSDSVLKMARAASCSGTLVERVPSSIHGKSSGQPDGSLLMMLMASCPTTSDAFFRMDRCGSCSMQARSSLLSSALTCVETVTPCASADCASSRMISLRSSTAASERTCSSWLLRSMAMSALKSESGACRACASASSAWLRTALSVLIRARSMASIC
mmetsp:Transcript_12840/g.41015  ORF Transcript_12840/g.41015 Transcript_12840/m.41015 type:complete len:228 (-) Transcript_12840:108-791(-)